jgi:beta-lactamase regulating signal transducer with metallopeptidase domain
MEDIFIRFSESLPAATGLMLLVVFLSRRKSTATRGHMAIVSGLLLVAFTPLLVGLLPKWRILPHVVELPDSLELFSAGGSWFHWLGITWMFGAVLFLGRVLVGYVTLERMRYSSINCEDELERLVIKCCARHGISEPVSVVLHPNATMPLTFGWRRPIVMLPLQAEEWPEDELETVLLHELAHVQRGDYPIGVLGQIVLSLYWFHPLAWSLNRRLELAQEMACDDQVLLAGKDAAQYVEHLAHLGAGLNLPVLPQTAAGFLGRRPLLVRALGIADPWRLRSRQSVGELAQALTPIAVVAMVLCSLGFKAAAEYRVSFQPNRTETAGGQVLSVWDDVVEPAVAVWTRPSSAKSLVASTTLPSTPFVAGSSSTPPSKPQTASPAGQSATAATDVMSLPIAVDSFSASLAPLPSDYATIGSSRQLRYSQSFGGISTTRRAVGLPSVTPTPGPSETSDLTVVGADSVNSSPEETSASETIDFATTAELGSAESDTSTPTSEPEQSKVESKKQVPSTTPQLPKVEEPWRLSANLVDASGESMFEFTCLVPNTVITAELQPEWSTDLRHWHPVKSGYRLDRSSGDEENDRVKVRLASATSESQIRFIRLLRRGEPATKPDMNKPEIPSRGPIATAPLGTSGTGVIGQGYGQIRQVTRRSRRFQYSAKNA